MPETCLKTVLTYRSGISLNEARMPTDVPETELPGIEHIFPELRFPSCARTYLHGTRMTGAYRLALEYAANHSPDARSNHLQLYADVGHLHRGKVSLAPETYPLSETRFLDLTYCQTDIWRELAPLLPTQTADGWPMKPTANPWLVGELVKLDGFTHLAVVAYRIKTDIGVVKVATLFDQSVIRRVKGWPSRAPLEIVRI
jgi:hypothetical protein